MAKRFTDTNKFNDPWYRRLSILHKVIWEYLLAECNYAGILDNFDLDLMSFKIGEKITLENMDVFKDKIIFISDKTLYIPKFISFQYGELNAKNKVHINVLKELTKWNISDPPLLRVRSSDDPSTGLNKKEEEKNKNNNKKIKNKIINNISNNYLYNENDLKNYGEYLNVTLTSEQYGKLLAMCASQKMLDKMLDDFSANIEIGKEEPFKAELPNAHFERLKRYYNYRKQNPAKFIEEKKADEPYMPWL